MPLILPPGDFHAFLFDCDGTVVDSMPLHFLAWRQALGECGCTTFTEELFYGWGGLPAVVVIETLNREQNLHMPAALVAERKEDLYYDTPPPAPARPRGPRARARRPRHASPSPSSPAPPANPSKPPSTALDLLDCFDTLVCAGDYTHGKPHPEPFLLAAERLGVAPAACLVFEDADPGIVAATAAGMASVKVPPPWERNPAR